MKKVHRFDANGFYVEDVLLEDDAQIPNDCTAVPLPQGIYLPAKFTNGQWATTATQDEINAMFPFPEPSEIDDLKKQLADLSYILMMNGVV